ncbi:MAG: head GIN domain-containing protein [Draconibacterium sp.]
MKQISLFLAALVIGLAALAGNSDKTETRNVSNFKGVDVSAGIDLYITMGETESVKIIADDDIIEKIITEVKDGVLHIYVKQNNWFNWTGNETRKAYVTIKELNKIEASSGADVNSENTLKGEELKINVSSGAEVEVDVYYKNLEVSTSSGSDAKLTGKVKNLEASSSSGSDISAKELESVVCKASASSGSDITVNVSDELYASASSGADINYYGNPSVKDIDESSGGDVSRK